MYNFCTLFDTRYLSRGIALYESLQRNCNDFHLYIFPFDENCYKVLKHLSLEKVTLISLKQFEDEELLRIKPTRTRGEYCWTSTSSTILYVLENFKVESCTYIDADLYFYSDPKCIFDEIGSNSVLLTEHRYSKRYDYGYNSGKYCVQFVYFKNDKNGIKALKWWRNECIKWCYCRNEDGKFGDQKYLDDWMERFEGVHELQHLGGGVAPWNIQQYSLQGKGENLLIYDSPSEKYFSLIFYHFHQLSFLNRHRVKLCKYSLASNVVNKLYKPYIEHLCSINLKLSSIFPDINFNDYSNEFTSIFAILNNFRYNLYLGQNIIKY